MVALVAIAAGVWPTSRACGQTRPEVIRGRVATNDGRVIAGADVIVTNGPEPRRVSLHLRFRGPISRRDRPKGPATISCISARRGGAR